MNRISPLMRRASDKIASLGTIQKFILIALISFFIFALSKGPPPGQNHFVYLADAFLHGRLSLSGGGISLAEVVPQNGNYYVVYPPMPAILLLPFVALFGTSFDQSLLSIMLASLCVSITWLMLKKTGSNGNKALWLAALFGFGTCFWYIASVGSSWYIEHVSAVLFLTSAIILALYRKSDFAVGLLLGCAALSRLPTVLAFPFFLLLIYDRNSSWKPRFKQAAFFVIGLAHTDRFECSLQRRPIWHFSRRRLLLDTWHTGKTHSSNKAFSTSPTYQDISTQSFSKDQLCSAISHT